MDRTKSRREMLKAAGLAALGLGAGGAASAQEGEAPTDDRGRVIPGFEEGQGGPRSERAWEPVSERKVRVGIAGYGLCKFGAQFGFQNHPNVEVTAVTDLIPQRRRELAKACGCQTMVDSCERMIEDDSIEAVFIATDAPSHARLVIAALEKGKHVASAVPAVYGSLEDADRLLEAVRAAGSRYMMFETSCYHAELYAYRQQH